MRKLSAILLILLFTGSQYARQISYFQCKLSNTFRSAPYQCDCEKQAGISKKGAMPSPAPVSHTHHFPDEFFSLHFKEESEILYSICNVFKIIDGAADLHEGNYPGPWRPPDT